MSKIKESIKNLSLNSPCHCLRMEAGVMHKILRLFSAHSWLMTRPASIVLPRPTSSAKIAPLESGFWNANKAASIWCGVKSMVELRTERPNFVTELAGFFKVNNWAKYCALAKDFTYIPIIKKNYFFLGKDFFYFTIEKGELQRETREIYKKHNKRYLL